ncbi:MAG TPA: hypothetical protein VGS12_02525, partial [Caulobacteraceae bacterium]|nr:hypothetical protein [Caulobacteraceae bacterium]
MDGALIEAAAAVVGVGATILIQLRARAERDGSHGSRLDDVEEDVRGLKEDVRGLKEDLPSLKTSSEVLATRVGHLDESVRDLRGSVDALRAELHGSELDRVREGTSRAPLSPAR